MKNTAIVLAAGSGSRMRSDRKKQYMLLLDRPVVCYSLDVFEKSPRIDNIILVCGAGDETWCRQEIVEAYHYKKVKSVVAGGKERYHSVYEGLKAAGDECRTVLIHDGARPLIDEAMIGRLLDEVEICRACVAAMPVKDTIKLSGQDGYVEETLPRDRLWMIQTPQVFEYRMILEAYRKVIQTDDPAVKITDDAMVLEYAGGPKIKLVEGSYENIKITTPEDIPAAEAFLKRGMLPL
ncbi:MAG: 2-C-methyl-D-erythritol 4-phosphate cytidylyltransferase [Lachnospiraceae bacterium]|nr:2-C-methyl-D-erythritol 4-phosphate cytidylyltransferase [Lachnospiraceae bacterium]